tara:strand:+ start:14336 stop:14596 length:261 start_codon:yes stop_codon:yes gene_type:complete
MNAYQYVENLTAFLQQNTGSCLSVWSGKMTATDQRKLFGRFLGKGTIVINGANETICNRVKVCFGLDWDDRSTTSWSELVVQHQNT